MTDETHLTQLGQPSDFPASPEAAQLDRVPNPHPDTAYVARFTVPEFTSICPVTGQPDFAHLVIDYVPGALVDRVEVAETLPDVRSATMVPFTRTVRWRSASASKICSSPTFIRIAGYWYPRGGIPDRCVLAGRHGAGRASWLPDQGVATYRGRG